MTPAPTKPSEALRAARELLSDPKRWTQGVAARDAEGNETSEASDDAVCFCTYGALWRVTRMGNPVSNDAESFIAKVIQDENGRPYIDYWNDDLDTTHQDIMTTFDRAIALAEEAGQ